MAGFDLVERWGAAVFLAGADIGGDRGTVGELRGLAEEGQELAEREVHCLWSGEMRLLGDERDGSWGEAGAYCVCSVGVVEVYWDTDMYSMGCFAYLGGRRRLLYSTVMLQERRVPEEPWPCGLAFKLEMLKKAALRSRLPIQECMFVVVSTGLGL